MSLTLLADPASLPTTPLRLYFENPVGRILEHPAGYAVIAYHAGPRDLYHLQAFLTHALHLLRRRDWNRLFGDQRQLLPFSEEESAWIVQYWLSQQQQGRPIYAAVLLLPDVLASFPPAQQRQEAQAGVLTYRLFDDEAAAHSWLAQLPSPTTAGSKLP